MYYLQYDTVGGGGNCFIFLEKQFSVLQGGAAWVSGKQLSALRGQGGVQAPWACLGLYCRGGLGRAKRVGVPLLGGKQKRARGRVASPPPGVRAAALVARDACAGAAWLAKGRGGQGTWLPVDG